MPQHERPAAPAVTSSRLETTWLCRCGNRGLGERCPVCRIEVCRDCAVFIDPRTRRATRPSRLISDRVTADVMAHRWCLDDPEMFTSTWVHQNDVEVLLAILRAYQPKPGGSTTSADRTLPSPEGGWKVQDFPASPA